MKKIVFISLLLVFMLVLIECNVNAQYYLGAKIGWCTPNLSGGNNEVSQGYTTRTALNFGAVGSYEFNNNWSLQVEANYASQGGKKEGLQAILNPMPGFLPNPYFYANFKNLAILNYLEIPILAKYTFHFTDNAFKIYFDLGPYIGYLLNAKTKATGTSDLYIDKAGTQPLMVPNPLNPTQEVPVNQSFNADSTITQDIHRFNYGVTGGVGFSKPFGNGDAFLDLRGSYGLTNIQKYAVDGKNNTGAFVVSIGYVIKLD